MKRCIKLYLDIMCKDCIYKENCSEQKKVTVMRKDKELTTRCEKYVRKKE